MLDHHDHSHAHCGHDHDFDGVSADYRLRLWIVIAINALMFGVELTAGTMAGSQSLKADALDFLADTLTYGISMAVIGMPLHTRATAALAKGISLSLMGLWILASTICNVFIMKHVPQAPIMGGVAIAALIANGLSVLILASYAKGDSNVRSVWLCSRNDMIGNVFVVAAAFGVWGTDTAWPDLIVAGVMASLFLQSSVRIIRQAIKERAGSTPS